MCTNCFDIITSWHDFVLKCSFQNEKYLKLIYDKQITESGLEIVNRENSEIELLEPSNDETEIDSASCDILREPIDDGINSQRYLNIYVFILWSLSNFNLSPCL